MRSVKPDAYLEVKFSTTVQGGRKGAVEGEYFGCLLLVEGDYFDCRLILNGRRLELGQIHQVPIVFLRPDLVMQKLSDGGKVTLWEGKEIGVGQVIRLASE